MKSTLTDQDLIDASKAHTHYAGMELDRSNFTEGMLLSMRAIADAAVARVLAEGKVPHAVGFKPKYETLLRDEFAGRALPWLLENVATLEAPKCAYKLADAMMEARNANR